MRMRDWTIVAMAAAAPLPAVAQEAAFRALADRYVAGVARLDPGHATALGEHRYDALVTDVGARGRTARRQFARATLRALDHIDRATLSPGAQVDAAMLDNALRYDLWRDAVLQDWAWDATLYAEQAGTALYSLAARDFAPWPVRLRAATARMRALPALFAQTRASLVPARVPPTHAQTAARQHGGLLGVVDTMLAPHLGTLPPADAAAFRAARADFAAAVAVHQRWLDQVLVPQAKGDFRLGAALYDQKMRFTLDSPVDRATLKARAERAAADTRAAMYAIAREMDPALPPAPTPAGQQAAIAAALERSYQRTVGRTELRAASAQAMAETIAFVRRADLVTIPDAPFTVIDMPAFQQGFAVAYADAPGPLDRTRAAFFAVSPVPAAWTDTQARSFLREYNHYMIHNLAVHEAMPGHLHQLSHGNGAGSTLRTLLGSGPFVEGWAVYAEELMMEAGYLDRDPLYRLTVLKMRLRTITNTLLDIGIHTGAMTRDQAMALMTEGAFQEEREAAGKWTRAQLSSTQLLTYFAGYLDHKALAAEAFAKGWAPRVYHDKVLMEGAPPVRHVRALLFRTPVAR